MMSRENKNFTINVQSVSCGHYYTKYIGEGAMEPLKVGLFRVGSYWGATPNVNSEQIQRIFLDNDVRISCRSNMSIMHVKHAISGKCSLICKQYFGDKMQIIPHYIFYLACIFHQTRIITFVKHLYLLYLRRMYPFLLLNSPHWQVKSIQFN